MKIVFAGGGTGGHVYPAIALADALRDRNDVWFVGTKDRLEATIVPKAGYSLATILAKPLARTLSVASVTAPFANAIGIGQSLELLARILPDVVVATGGYACFPVVVAAKILRTLNVIDARIALLEPNARPGLTNRLLAPLVDEVWGATERGDPRFTGKYVRTGVPVRASLTALPPRAQAAARLGLDPSRRTLLAIGGSLGAARINDAIAWFDLDGVPAGWQILLLAGARDARRMREECADEPSIHVVAYLDDPSDAFAVADLIVARAGASTLAELAAVGVPAILVPYPFASDDHQRANALSVVQRGAAIVVDDAALDGPLLAGLLSDRDRLDRLGEAARSLATVDATRAIVARIQALAARRPGT